MRLPDTGLYDVFLALLNRIGSIVEECELIYEIKPWLRYAIWAALVSTTLFLIWVAGGFPPQAWLLLIQLLLHLSHLWSFYGSLILLPLLALSVLSMIWLVVWSLLVWGSVRLACYQWRLYQCREGQGISRWLPAQKLQLVVANAGDNATMEATLSTTVPRLRLPQKVQLKPDRLEAAHTSKASRALSDIPTRPSESALSSESLAEATTENRSMLAQSLSVGVGWHTGITRKRSPNEDSLLVLQGTCTYQGRLVPFGLFVVADGMGGHAYGQEASRLAIQNMMHTVLQNIVMSNDLDDEYLTNMLIGGVEWANRAIYQRGQEWGQEMGTTLTGALIVGLKVYIVNVGDSRTYLYREGMHLAQITRDHSVVAALVESGTIAADDVYTHPERNKVYRSLGCKESVEVDWFVVDLCAHDKLLLCSDGLWEMVRDPMIERIAASGYDPTRICSMLVQAALRGGGQDNVSAIMVELP
ncbi:serine/threonine-protein phosphatase [Ktedonosporobacter rubrisoli]|uniref:Serine/threonine-protein phosphatase n=1 Tax=Ktedonosporobacter rubrisoli TaxID=2509675 RepID=A0A4P6K599_KTERU|nr:protein phosphatase 2C domain-containing protein [Ktedonosporobacter rubrisoli]QBD83123.1 serine/threonine-protein phosphatase [Ktedonosporobacter rubrisoli]